MAKIPRKNQKIFGTSAGLNQIAKFGSLAAGSAVYTTDPETIQALSNYLDGWYSGVVGQNSPAIQDMNALCYLFAYQLAYIFQTGIPEWNTSAIYYKGSLVSSNGVVYRSLTDTNTGNALSSVTNWAFADGGIAKSADFSVSEIAGGYLVDVSGGTRTASLPAASTATGAMIGFKNKSFGSGNVITIAPNGADNIEGANASISVAAGEFVQLFCDGSAWYIWNP